MSAAEVLLEHAPYDSGFRCECGWEVPKHVSIIYLEHPLHQLEALKAAGYAVMELPKPSEPDDEGYTTQFYAGADCSYVRVRWSKDIVADGLWYRSAAARDLGAALIAAAEAAS